MWGCSSLLPTSLHNGVYNEVPRSPLLLHVILVSIRRGQFRKELEQLIVAPAGRSIRSLGMGGKLGQDHRRKRGLLAGNEYFHDVFASLFASPLKRLRYVHC